MRRTYENSYNSADNITENGADVTYKYDFSVLQSESFMKSMMLVLMFILLVLACNPLYSQLTHEQKQIIQQDINKYINKEAFIGPWNISTEQLLFRNSAKIIITQAIRNNDAELATRYFDIYAIALDSLVFTNPIAARQLVFDLKVLYDTMDGPIEKLQYYSSSVEYYLGFYDSAESELLDFQLKYPSSELSSAVLTLLLKTYIAAGRESEAFEIIEKRKDTLNQEQHYLAGHISFALGKDEEAVYHFSRVSNESFKQDTSKMLALISALKKEPAEARKLLETQLQYEPTNPFLLLNLARLSSLSGNWEEAEQYYSQYIPAAKKHWEMQVQYELATAYLNKGDKERAADILDRAIRNPEFGEYISPLLYLWSEVAAGSGSVEDARIRANTIRIAISNNADIITEKIRLINRINALKESAGRKSDPIFMSTALDEVEIISGRLNSLNESLSNNHYGISSTEYNRWVILEKQIILSMLDQLNFYSAAENITGITDTLRVQQLDSLKVITEDQVTRIKKIKQTVLRLNDRNTYLALRNEVDNTLAVLDKITNNLIEKKASQDPAFTVAQLDSLIAANERKKAETEMLLDYYDYDNELYREVMAEIKASDEDSIELMKDIASLKQEFNEKYPKYIGSKEKKAITNEIAQLPLLVPEYLKLLSSYQGFLNTVKTHVEYIGHHIAFIETSYYDKSRKQKEASLSFEASQKLYNENLARKRKTNDQIKSFVNKYSNENLELKQLENFSINILANAYFALAELSSSLEQERMHIALDYYRKVLEQEPKFYLRDVVLYNIGYISGNIVKHSIETRKEEFETMYPNRLKPDSLRLTEITYKEPIEAYKRIVNEFPDSQYNSEALFRLGYLYFEIGTDAMQPVEYYQIARSYYDKLIERDNDPYHFKALYQRGWTWLNSSSEEAYHNAINDFIAILNAINSREIVDEVEVIDYSLAAKKNISYCLVGLDGTDYNARSKGAEYAKRVLTPILQMEDLFLIIDEAITHKLALYLPMQAIDFMNAKMEIDPLAINNPVIADSICALYQAYPTHVGKDLSADSLYIAEKEKIVQRFNHNSEWYNANRNKNIDKQLQIVKQAFIDLEKRYNNEFVDYPSVANFQKYIDLVNLYTQFHAIHSMSDPQYFQWNETIQANIIAQNIKLIQQTKDAPSYLALANRIYSFNDEFPKNKSFFSLEETAYNCARVVIDSLKTDIAKLKAEHKGVVIPFNANNSTKYFQSAAQRFVKVLTDEQYKSVNNDRIYLSVILRQAEIARDLKHYDESETYYRMIIGYDGEVAPDVKRTSYISLAELAELKQDYKESELLYKSAQNYALNDEDREVLHQYALLQIQNSVDLSKSRGDNQKVAEEYLRLANEYNDTSRSLQYKGKAQIAYLEAAQYQKSIDLLIEMSQEKKTSAEVLNFYRLAWSIADSVGFKAQSESLKQSFVNKFPSSYESYQLRLGFIDKLADSQETVSRAAAMTLELYEDVVNKRIEAGNDKPTDLYLAAIGLYDQAGVENQKENLARDFITRYPEHPATITLMEYLADKELAKDNLAVYEQYAKAIFQKDKTKSARYTNIAKVNLGRIANQFTNSAREKDWTEAFRHMNEFKKVHQSYQKEGLSLDFRPIYAAFQDAEQEYKIIQARKTYIDQFRQTLRNVERGSLTQRSDNLIRVNLYTKWKRHLVGGEHRIRALKNSSEKEINIVKSALESGAKYNLDVEDRLKAFDLICRIAEHSAKVTKTQIDKYMDVSVEFADYKKQYYGAEDELYGAFNAQKEGHSLSFLQLAYPYYLVMYKYFYIPGLRNQYTNKAYTRLQSLNALPGYKTDYLDLSTGWEITSVSADNPLSSVPFTGKVIKNNAPGLKEYSSVTIPPNAEIVFRKAINTKIPYEYAVLRVTSPYPEDIVLKLQDKPLEYTYHPIDTLSIGGVNPVITALIFGENKFTASSSVLEMRFPNYSQEPLTIHMNLVVVRDSVKVETLTPKETITLNTNDVWQYAKYGENIADSDWTCSVPAVRFNFDKEQLFEMENTTAIPIWALAGDEDSQLVFRKIFYIDGVLREGFIRFIAPETATVILNDKVLTSDYPFNYDPESKLVFAGQINLKQDNVRFGKNTLQIIVHNRSKWKGLMAELDMVVAYLE